MRSCVRSALYCTATFSLISTLVFLVFTTRTFFFDTRDQDPVVVGRNAGVSTLNLLNGFKHSKVMLGPVVLKSTVTSSSGPPTLRLNIPKDKLKLVGRGENIQAGEQQVHITTAVYYKDYPLKPGFNVFLNGWARHNDSMDFKCCFFSSLPEADSQGVTVTEVAARMYNVYRQWIVDMQNAEFSCSVPTAANATLQFRYVTFVKLTCRDIKDKVMRIEMPEVIPKSVGVCLKVTYGKVNPEKMVEWFEFMKLMKVTRVFTYYFDVEPEVLRVLQYYNKTGFLDLLLIHPAKSRHGKDRGFRHPRYSEQAFVDEVMAVNDCKHRMSRFDYVVIMDIDEFILPKGNITTYYDLFKLASNRFPKAGGFQVDAYVVMTSWGATRDSPLHFTRYTNRTLEANYDGAHRNTRWVFIPQRTFYARNNYVYTRSGFNIAVLPHDISILFHYRNCKRQWVTCNNSTRVTDDIVVKYESRLVENISRMTLTPLLYKSTDYIKHLRDWHSKHKTQT
ncbi:uncharacterized protein LOC106050629 isoform X1 [Biomphalaria glabrata]|uniref:Glycosyltransferase family 92 protein n=1 Tax=Biomphalaria glabrata TaxID=6526 RepID=A0A9W2YW66_BIOGL|nr:uncharacterized protein LOC106050629 isoform X1 [Biomphalaria glabrata]XP_055866963.1 uncharacterized protein LOC106050629 isoform X1 [Biomphalaria glabrata]